MTNYFKVYLTSKTGKISKQIAKDKVDVMKILQQAKKEGFLNYIVIKRIKHGTDITIGQGSFYKECKVSFVENLETDWRVVGNMVVNYKKYKEYLESEDKERF